MTLVLKRKTGSIPKGTYAFIECYCTDPGCDCRRTTVIVVNDKFRQKAAISFGFDPDGPMAGPFLEALPDQAPYAPELLDYFVQAINTDGAWLARMYEQYRAVRKKVDGKAYRGRAFPKPGKTERSAMLPPPLDHELERILEPPAMRKKGAAVHPSLFGDDPEPAIADSDMSHFVTEYRQLHKKRAFSDHNVLQNELHRHLFTYDQAADDLARLVANSFREKAHAEAALRMLYDALEMLRADLERNRAGAQERMERLQGALAQRIFLEQEDPDLCASVTNLLLQSRVEILPVLHEANSRRMEEGADRFDLPMIHGEDPVAGLFKCIEEMGVTSPFEGIEAILQLFALGEPDLQISLGAEMIDAQSPLFREVAVLMLFHPSAEVRKGMSAVLAGCDGHTLTPDALRRLIVARNWFPEEIRRNMDRAIGNARKARVPCAPLPKRLPMKVHASAVDGAGAQSFQVLIPEGKGFNSCSFLLKQGIGVADAFVVPLKNRRELNGFLAMMKNEVAFLESTPEHLDQRICHALAEGARAGKAPSHWLVYIAEILGRDQWKAAAFDACRELEELRRELATRHPKLLSEREAKESLLESAEWTMEDFAASWFEDDEKVDREVEKTKVGRRKEVDPWRGMSAILNCVLPERRGAWLERLVLTTLWLKSASKPPVAWHRMYHVAEALADETVPLKEIPLMLSIAEGSLGAYFARRD